MLERVDRLVEPSPIRVRQVGGGWSAFAAARDAERALAGSTVEAAEPGLKEASRAAQTRRGNKTRRTALEEHTRRVGARPLRQKPAAKVDATTGDARSRDGAAANAGVSSPP